MTCNQKDAVTQGAGRSSRSRKTDFCSSYAKGVPKIVDHSSRNEAMVLAH